MKKTFITLVLGVLFTKPCVLHAEEIEIQLMEVISMGTLPGDNPMDDPVQTDPRPVRPNDFRATINGFVFAITKQNETIPAAQATVANVTTGSVVLNQQFTTSLSEQIASAGMYVLHIQTESGALVGQFLVQ